MLKRAKVVIKDEKSSYYVGKLEDGTRIKISRDNLQEKLYLSSKYYVSGEFKKSLFSNMLIVSEIEDIKGPSMLDDYDKDYLEIEDRIKEKNFNEASRRYHESSTEGKKAGEKPDNIYGEVYGNL